MPEAGHHVATSASAGFVASENQETKMMLRSAAAGRISDSLVLLAWWCLPGVVSSAMVHYQAQEIYPWRFRDFRCSG